MSPDPALGPVRGVETAPQVTTEPESQTETQSQSAAASTTAENSLRVDSARIDDVLNLVGELILGKSMLQQTMGEFDKRFNKDPLRSKFEPVGVSNQPSAHFWLMFPVEPWVNPRV